MKDMAMGNWQLATGDSMKPNGDGTPAIRAVGVAVDVDVEPVANCQLPVAGEPEVRA